MPIQVEYMGMMLTVEDVDRENREFFGFCAKGEFRLQRGSESGLLRYPPTTQLDNLAAAAAVPSYLGATV